MRAMSMELPRLKAEVRNRAGPTESWRPAARRSPGNGYRVYSWSACHQQRDVTEAHCLQEYK